MRLGANQAAAPTILRLWENKGAVVANESGIGHLTERGNAG